MGKNSASRRKYSQVVAGFAALVSLSFGACFAEAASFLNSCTTYCHGTPPRDGARKGNPHFGSQSSAFIGNHKNHLSAAPSTNDCSICHAPVVATGFGHQNNVVDMAVKLKGYSTSTGRARYDKGVFFNMTSIPNLTNATCSNVSCHFEKKTPVWGSAAFNPATDCNACHGAPPAGTVAAPTGGLAGSHARHDVYFTGTANCQKCHPNSTSFIHATSAGRALKVQGFLRDPLNTPEAAGSYSGTGLNYQPSKSAAPGFGSCSAVYCHSTGQSTTGAGPGTTVTTPAWGSGALNCGSCHVDMSSSASATGSHAAHAQSSGTAYTCDVCHGTGFGVAAVNTATHVNKQINLSFTGNAVGTTYVTKGTAFAPGSAVYNSCATSNCHGAMTPTWGANTAKVRCQKCHGYRSSGWNALNGATATTDTKVGVHFNHISSSGSLKYSKPLSCAECHATSIALSTDNVNAAGHFDTAGPADVAFGTLAKTNTNTPTYTASTCANNYCHGSNMASNISNPPASRVASPVWNVPFLGTASVVGDGSTTPGTGDCSKCHGYPPMTTTHAGKLANACSGCHSHVNATGTGFINSLLHINGTVDASGGSCIGCHASAQTGTHGTPRGAVVTEFGLAWGHKKAGRGAVTDADCIVCHLEGDFTTQKPSAKHQDGNIDLRDPDGVGEVAITNISGAAFTFKRYSASYAAGSRTSTGHLSNTDIANVISQKFCLACHDSNGATNPTARSNNGGTGTAFMPWGGINLGSNYTVANGAASAGGVVNVKAQFAITNSSRHPLLGPLVKDFPYSTRLAAPYNNIGTARDANGTTGHVTANSVVLNCFDCHTASVAPLTTRTIVAHGGTETLRGTTYTTTATLCNGCHTGYTNASNHSTGSAWAATGSSHNVSQNCHYCHGSNTSSTKPARPLPAQDYHGSNALVSGGLWPTTNSRPYAFIRGWTGNAYHRPYRGSETALLTGSATCGAGTCPGGGQVGDGSTRTYTPGGTY